MGHVLSVVVTIGLLGCAAPSGRPSGAPAVDIGTTKASAIQVCKVGYRDYLSRLVCASGEVPAYRRLGSVGPRTEVTRQPASDTEIRQRLSRMMRGARLEPGEPDTHIVDLYELSCGSKAHRIYVDMYHCEEPPTDQPPPNFTFR